MTENGDIQAVLGLSKPPIAIAFLDQPPAGLPTWSGEPVAAGCVFWKKAQEGIAFYTVPSDHYNCAIGAYTHSIPLPPERAGQLEQTLGFMVENQYVVMSEVPSIPTLPAQPAAIAYAPLNCATFAPDVIVLAATPAQAMRLYEAALKVEASKGLMHALGRPACALLPLVQKTGKSALSLGCMGNRTYTGLPDSEMYLCVPAAQWPALVEHLTTVQAANEAMYAYNAHRQALFPA